MSALEDPREPVVPPPWVEWLVQRRGLLQVLSLLFVLGAALGGPKLKFDVSNESLFLEGDQALVRYRQMQKTFGSDEVVLLMVEVEDAFAEPDRSRLIALGDALRKLELPPRPSVEGPSEEGLAFVEDLRSPFHAPVPFLDEEETIVSKPYKEALEEEGFEPEVWRQRVLAYRPFEDVLISKDARYVGYLVRLDPEVKTPQGRRQVTRVLTGLLEAEPWRELRAEVVGTPMMMTKLAEILFRELNLAIFGGVLVAGLILLVLFRSLRASLAPLAVVVTSLLATGGLMGWANVPLSTLSVILVTLLICVGVADAVHLISAYERRACEGLPNEQALAVAIAEIHLPCLFTSLTTAAGFLALLSSRLVPIRNLGVFAALGCLLAYALLLGLIPAMLVRWTPRARAEGAAPPLSKLLLQIHGVVTKRPWVVIALGLIVCAATIPGIPKLYVDRDLMKNLAPDEPLRHQLEFVHQRMGGTIACEVLLTPYTPPADLVPTAELLSRAAELEEWLRTVHPEVKGVTGITAGVEEMHRLMGGPSEVPHDDRQVAQLLLLLGSADGDYCNQHVATDGSSIRITVRFNLIGSREHKKILSEVEAEMAKRFEGLADARISGGAFLLSRSSDYVLATQKTSFALALLVVTILIAAWTRELRLGLLSVLPNLLPIAVVLGVMGWTGTAITVTNALITTIAIGIIVDDTIHLTYALREELQRVYAEAMRPTVSGRISRNAKVNAAIERALLGAGRAVLVTTLVLVGCFGVYYFSRDRGVRVFGLLSALTFLVAFLADVLLLPAMVKVWPASTKLREIVAMESAIQSGIGEAPLLEGPELGPELDPELEGGPSA